jgi:hypothetical protein
LVVDGAGVLAVQYPTLPDPSWALALSSHQRLVKADLACHWLMLGLHHAPSLDPAATTALVHELSLAQKFDNNWDDDAWSREQTPARRLESLINILRLAYMCSSSCEEDASSSPSTWRHWRKQGGRMDTVKCLFLLSRMLREDARCDSAENGGDQGDKSAVEARRTAASGVVVMMLASTAQASVDERKEMAKSWAKIASMRDKMAEQIVVALVKGALLGAEHPLLTAILHTKAHIKYQRCLGIITASQLIL